MFGAPLPTEQQLDVQFDQLKEQYPILAELESREDALSYLSIYNGMITFTSSYIPDEYFIGKYLYARIRYAQATKGIYDSVTAPTIISPTGN